MALHYVLLASGSNTKGQLGIGSYNDAHTFTPCQFSGCEPNQLPDPTSRVTRVACGANHTVLLLQHLDGSATLWGAGDGRMGQLGPAYPHDSEELQEVPWTGFHKLTLPLPSSSGNASCTSYVSREYTYKYAAAAWETTYVVFSHPSRSDVLLSMGSNDFGALGVGEGASASIGPVGGPHVVNFDHLFSDASGCPTESRTPMYIRSLQAGPRHVIAQLVVTSGGSSSRPQTVLVGWGASRHGQLGPSGGARSVTRPILLPIDVEDDPMISCALGNQHTVVLHQSGRISALGSNKQGQIPSPGTVGRICAVGCTWNGTYMQTVNDNRHVLLSMGNNAQGQLGRVYAGVHDSVMGPVFVNLDLDRAISRFVCGSEHVLAAMSGSSQEGDSVMGWGWNEHGNMGLGSLGNVITPTQIWPREDTAAYNIYPQRVVDMWAGCATSWLLVV